MGWGGYIFGFQRKPFVEKIRSLWKWIVNEGKEEKENEEGKKGSWYGYQSFGRRPSKRKEIFLCFIPFTVHIYLMSFLFSFNLPFIVIVYLRKSYDTVSQELLTFVNKTIYLILSKILNIERISKLKEQLVARVAVRLRIMQVENII